MGTPAFQLSVQLIWIMFWITCCQTCNEVSALFVKDTRPEVINICTPVTRSVTTNVILSTSLAAENPPDAPCTCRITLPAQTQLKAELVVKDEARGARSCDQAIVVQHESGADLCKLCEESNQDIIQCSDQTRTVIVKYTTTDSAIQSRMRASFIVPPESWFAVECGLALGGEPRLKQGPARQTHNVFTTTSYRTQWSSRLIPTTSYHSTTQVPSSPTPTVFSTSTPANIHRTVHTTSPTVSSASKGQPTLSRTSTMSPSSSATSHSSSATSHARSTISYARSSTPNAMSTRRTVPTTFRIPDLDTSKNDNKGLSPHVRDILKSKGFIVGVILGGNAMILIMIATTIISCRSHKKKMNRLKRYGSQRLILEGSVIGDSSDGCPTGSSEYGSVFRVTVNGSNDYTFTY